VRPGDLWTDAELCSAISMYLYLLQLKEQGGDFSVNEVGRTLQAGVLKKRNLASVRYRMRNISAVLRDRGWPTLRAFPPAAKSGGGVRARIEAILDELGGRPVAVDKAANEPTASFNWLKQSALTRLDRLATELSELDDALAHRGHNRPPSLVDAPDWIAEMRAARDDVNALREELRKKTINARSATNRKNSLRRFGLMLASWLGMRATKFANAAMLSLAPIVVAKATGVLPTLSGAIAAVARVLEHLAP
jgi:hypothetical protein